MTTKPASKTLGTPHSRREFLAASGAALALAAAGPLRGSVETPAPRRPLAGFSKPFQHLSPAQAAEFAAAVGWDGIECPVRAKGQVLPEKVEADLPVVLRSLQERNLSIEQVATDIVRIDQPHAEKVLRTCAALGLKRLRLGFLHYRGDRSPLEELNELRPALRDIAAACAELGLWAGIQNHSGKDYVGAPVWDVVGLIREINSPALGLTFDIGHATVEGGLSWPIQTRLAAPFAHSVIVKDFVWQKSGNQWREAWCPLGEGMVHRSYFDDLKRSDFAGPLIQHHEYEIPDLEKFKEAMKRDLTTLRSWMQ